MLPSSTNKLVYRLNRRMVGFVCNRVTLLFFSVALVVILARSSLDRQGSPSPPLSDSNQESGTRVKFVKTEPSNSDVSRSPITDKRSFQQREWCETDRIEQLGNHAVFSQFEQWLKLYEKGYCQDQDACLHSDPRRHLHLLEKGVRLARARATILESLITYDPQRALEVAVSPERARELPSVVRENMETWHTMEADLKAVHVCYNPKSLKGRIKRWATLSDGRTYEAFVYGDRRYLPTLSNVPVSGISIGDKMAVSEKAYRIVKQLPGEKLLIEYAGSQFAVNQDGGQKALDRRIRQADLIALQSGRFQTPLIASSTGGSANLIDLKYELFTTPMTWADANKTAFDKKGRIVCINSSSENNVVYQLLKDAVSLGLLPDGSGAIRNAWIGATDNEDQNGSYLDKDANQSRVLELNATEGDWHWLSNEDISSSAYQNWNDGNQPVNANKDFGAIDWSTSDAKWIDLNETYRLPFVIEYDVDLTPTPTSIVNGKRKVLILPTRFRDEGNNFDGSSSNPIDPFGNPTNTGNNQDAFEPDTRENLIRVMKEVKEFYLRNSDGTFHLDAVITPPITVNLPKWQRVTPDTPKAVDNRIFDSTGQVYWSLLVADDYDGLEIGLLGETARLAAAQISRYYDYDGPAFEGVLSVDVPAPFGSFEKPPLVIFEGGNVDLATGIPDPDFEPAQAEALVDASGRITQIILTEPGAFYHGTPTLHFDGSATASPNVTLSMGRTIVSWAAVSTAGSGGLGAVGAAGSHVNAPASGMVMAHELGHNFGLWHANRYVSEGLRANSDEGSTLDYGNPYSLMGSGGISGDLTISSKVFLKDRGFFGLIGGTGANSSIDVAHFFGPDVVENSGLMETDSISPNTFRIYRHDYGSAPYPLRTGLFTLSIPPASMPLGFSDKLPLNLAVGGPGEGASGRAESNGSGLQLLLATGGKGYSEEPVIQILNTDDSTVLLTLDQSWIKERSGSASTSYVQAALRDFSSTAHRGLRGVELPASEYTPLGLDMQTPSGSYWISYRRSVLEFGLSVINGTTQGFGTSENTLIDTTPATQANFEDAFLMLGRTFSDYEADSHVTPIAKGGTAPMEYVEVVVNVGTVGKGLAKAPEFEIQANDLTPEVDQPVELTVVPIDGNVSAYAYAWYQNEISLDDYRYLNKRTISKTFSSPGQYVLKVIVSDMRGGISSQNLVIRVGDEKKVTTSVLSGQVRSNQGPIQGAKVLVSKASIIEHSLSVSGTLKDSRIPAAEANHLRYVIDNEAGKQLILHRGEIHRFYLDPSTKNNPITFFDRPDHKPAEIKLNLLLAPLVDFAGSGYVKPPQIDLVGGSLFNSHFSQTVTTLPDYQNQPYGPNGTLISLPTAKSLLKDTNVTKIIVRPTSSDPNTGLHVHFGGTGQSRYFPPAVTVYRSSYWEDYTEPNATATPYVDGVGTITVSSLGSGYPGAPDIVVLGAGRDANVTATVRAKDKKKDSAQIKSRVLPTGSGNINVIDQGYGYDPNSTIAVALYPLEPIIYYSFDADESLFEGGPLKPTSGLNNRIGDKLKHYWQMNEENASTFENNVTATENFLVAPAIPDPSVRSKWGIKNKAIEVTVGSTFSATPSVLGDEFSLSLWVHPADAGGNPGLNLNFNSNAFVFVVPDSPDLMTATGFAALPPGPATGEWSHIVVTKDLTTTQIFLNGQMAGSSTSANPVVSNLEITGLDYLIDEIMIYERLLQPYEIMQLAGRLFLDLSGNKYHAAAMGGIDMTDSNPAGADDGLGGAPSGDLDQGIDLNGSQYLDLTANVKQMSSLDSGSISFWLKPSGNSEMTILSGSYADLNNSFYRLYLRDNGTIRQEVLSEGQELCKVTSDGSVDLSDGQWHHVVVIIGQNGVAYYVDGKSVASVVPAGSSNERAFLTDIDKINHLAIGYHRTSDSNATNYYVGQLDEFHVYDRSLTGGEISYLFNLGSSAGGSNSRVERARLNSSVDAVGTVTITDAGAGYQEQPEVVFSYDDATHFEKPAVGQGELFPTGVDRILLTKDLHGFVTITLPDDRNVSRRHVEYVGVKPLPNTLYDANWTDGIFGYSAPPDIVVEGSPTWPDDFNATAYPLFFLDRNTSVEIVNGGQGYDLSNAGLGFDADAVRIFGEGYRPPQFEAYGQFGRIDVLVVRQAGEGPYSASSGNFLFLGDDYWDSNKNYAQGARVLHLNELWQANAPVAAGDEPNAFSFTWGSVGQTTLSYDTKNKGPFINGTLVRRNTFAPDPKNNLYQVNGVKLDPKAANRGSGWITKPTVFADWGDSTWAGHVGITDLDFNATLSEIVVQDPGFRYSIPAKVNLYGGQLFDSNASSVFRTAVVEINGTDSNGGITSYSITDPGSGYVREPIVSITGGGGSGATALAFVEPVDGNLTAIFPIEPGRGYFNLDSNNTPSAKLIFDDPLAGDEKNASILLRLGGNLNELNIGSFRRYACQHPPTYAAPMHMTPWVEIYDRGRANVPLADQAEAAVKVRNGNITKIVVTRSGRGYVDPMVVVRGSPPKLDPYFTPNTKRQWQCAYLREDSDGTFQPCGHVHEGDTPPANCPGESPPGPQQVNAESNDNWWDNHGDACRNHYAFLGLANHTDIGFRTRSCEGGAYDFNLINEPYRFPLTDWLNYEANCSAIVHNGMIREIIIDDSGSRYISPHLEFKGTGGEVDAIPLFDDKGHLIHVFYDDPRIKNLEIDKLDRPLGAGQGFTERPWTKDGDHDTAFGPRENVAFVVYSDVAFLDPIFGFPNLLPQEATVYATVLPRDSWGDRVIDLEILDSGLFAQGTQATVQIDFDFNTTYHQDAAIATALAHFTNRLTRMELDHDGTHSWSQFPVENGTEITVTRSTFLAEPKVTIFNETLDAIGIKTQHSFFTEENKTSQVRLNGLVGYDPLSERSYVDLVVDDRLPNKFYYGLGGSDRLSMGGEIIVMDGMPYANWGTAEEYDRIAYTDANGFYAVSDLEPGLYNVAVLMEDEKYQDMTFRPESNSTLISRTIYVPGIPSLELETDRRGLGKSRLVWSLNSRQLGQTETPVNPPDALKVLEGIGAGFVNGKPIHLTVVPHSGNTSRGKPKISHAILVDGSLRLTVVDDQNSTVFDPEDRFTVNYSSSINLSGIDFVEDYSFEDLNYSYWGGSQNTAGKRQLIITPSAGGEYNHFEVPIASSGDPNAGTAFSVKAFDENGNAVTPIVADWNLIFDFNATDGNYSKIASLDVNQSETVNFTLRSTLQGGTMRLNASALVNGVETNASVRIVAFQHVPLTEREHWMDEHFYTVWETAIDWNSDDQSKGYDGDGLTNAEEWKYRTDPFLADTDGDTLADKVETDATHTNPLSKDTDGDGFSDNLEVDVVGLDPLAYNQAPPAPEFTFNSGLETMSAFAGSKVLLGAIVKESSIDGSGTLVDLAVSMEGNFSQVVSSSNGEWLVSQSASSGTYHVNYKVNDSLNREFSKTQYILITALDLTPPAITLSDPGPLYVLKGGVYSRPFFSSYDETDGVLSASVTVAGEDSVDVNKTGIYEVTFSVTDQAGNPGSTVLQVIVEDYAYVIEGKAIDGYLIGSSVIFDAFKNGVHDGVHDLASPVTTDGSGQFVLSLTTPELALFDSNQNGKIDSNEGRIIVSGGFDVTTNSPFAGSYSADANSTVVSPLSTLVSAVMAEGTGMSKEEAKTRVSQALGLPATIDPTNYDPLAAAANGDADSTKVLLETARLANVMNQVDAFAEYRGIPFTSPGQAGTAFISELAEQVGAWKDGDSNPLSDDTLVQQALVLSLQSIQPGTSTADTAEAAQFIRMADTLLVQTAASGAATNALAVSLAKNQKAIVSEVIGGYASLTENGDAISTLTITKQDLETQSASFDSINVFPPSAPPFSASIRAGDWSAGNQLASITGADADGDAISYSITSRNFDLDGDGTLPFSISSTGVLSISDPDDLTTYAATMMEVAVSLSDGKGMSSTIKGSLLVDNLLSLTSSPLSDKAGWATSSWLGSFYSSGSSWVYHPSLSWLYVSPDNSNGFWFWDSAFNGWWWTKPDVFPHFYHNTMGWSYWDLSGNARLYYDYSSKTWVTP